MQEPKLLLESLQDIARVRVKDPLKEEAWKHFLAKGLPAKDEEAFRYVLFHELHQKNFSSLEENSLVETKPSQDDVYRFAFVNGRFNKALSTLEDLPSEIVYCSIKEAFKSYGSLLKGRFSKFLKEDNSALSFLNYALFEEGFFLYIPPSTTFEKKIEIVEHYSGASAEVFFPKLSIYIGKQAKVTFKTKASSLQDHFIDRHMEVHLESGAHCKIENDTLDVGSSWYFDHIAAYLKRDAHFSYVSGDRGGKLLRQEYKVYLLEENAEAFLKGLSILQNKDQSHHHVRVEHLAPSCRSHQHFKGLMFDLARLSFEGKIWVDKIAQQTQAYQLSNNLLLGERALAYVKPNLEIFADDVKASHGATIAQLSEEEIFYLQTRGLEPSFAKTLLVKGFCKELTQEMSDLLSQNMLYHLQTALNKG